MDHVYDKTSSDHCVFVKKFPNGKYIILLLYVDGMLIVGHDKNDIQSLKRELSKIFAMKDLSPAKQILDMKIVRDRKNGKLWLSPICINEFPTLQRFQPYSFQTAHVRTFLLGFLMKH